MAELLSTDEIRDLILKTVGASNRPLTQDELTIAVEWAEAQLVGYHLMRALQKGELRLDWPDTPVTSLEDFDDRVSLAARDPEFS